MCGQRCRRPTPWDAIILLGATAAALAAVAAAPAFILTGRRSLWPHFDLEWEHAIDYLFCIRSMLYSMSYVAAAWSLAFLGIRLRRPRPGLRRLVRQPGMAAATATAVVLGIRLMNLLSVQGVLNNDDSLEAVPSEIGCAIAAVWTVQALGGRWRPERCWIDRAGRLLGLFWIVTTPFSWFDFTFG